MKGCSLECTVTNFLIFVSSLGETETIQLNEDIVNLGVKLGPPDFELKKVLGKGGYGKVFQVTTIISAAKRVVIPHFSIFR